MPASRATHTGFSMYHATIGQRRYVFHDLKALLGKASPLRSGDQLAGIAAESGGTGRGALCARRCAVDGISA
jgi:ethanolamine ammonia-lyase large subunit